MKRLLLCLLFTFVFINLNSEENVIPARTYSLSLDFSFGFPFSNNSLKQEFAQELNSEDSINIWTYSPCINFNYILNKKWGLEFSINSKDYYEEIIDNRPLGMDSSEKYYSIQSFLHMYRFELGFLYYLHNPKLQAGKQNYITTNLYSRAGFTAGEITPHAVTPVNDYISSYTIRGIAWDSGFSMDFVYSQNLRWIFGLTINSRVDRVTFSGIPDYDDGPVYFQALTLGFHFGVSGIK